jgi:hypothetical protein
LFFQSKHVKSARSFNTSRYLAFSQTGKTSRFREPRHFFKAKSTGLHDKIRFNPVWRERCLKRSFIEIKPFLTSMSSFYLYGKLPMKLATTLFVLSTLIATAAVNAAPMPGHPSPAAAADMMHLPKNTADVSKMQKGKVVSAIPANEYTYIEVTQGKNTLWIAAPATPVKKNNVIRFEDGAVMSNFHSKLLNRTFPSVTFVSRVIITKEKE